MRDLTPRQREVLAAIRTFTESCGFAPTIRELCAILSIRVHAVVCHLRAIEAKGFIRSEPKVPRGIRILKSNEQGDLPANV